jgi:cell division transport system permease protein
MNVGSSLSPRVIGGHLGQAWGSLWRAWRTSLLSMATIVAAVFVLGLALLVSATIGRAVEQWGRAAELSVFLDTNATADARSRVERALRDSPVVREVTYVSPEQAAGRLGRQFPDLAGLGAALGPEALPSSFDVRLVDAARDQSRIGELAQQLMRLPGVSDVRYDRALVDRLARTMRVARLVGYALAAILGLAAALAVLSVVRLSYVSRRDEAEILLLVGAPFGVIRGPFVAEGWLQGTLGAVAALALLAAGFGAVRARYGAEIAAATGLDRLAFLPPGVWLSIVVLSGIVGALAGAAAVGRRFWKTT